MSFQMALDELLFDTAKKDPSVAPVLRFYFSSEPWISAGYSFRNGRDEARSELMRAHRDLPVAKRLTGGGCVLHGRDLIFTLLIPPTYPPLIPGIRGGCRGGEILGSVKESYKTIHACVAKAFQGLGVDPRFYGPSEGLPKGDDCFTYPVEDDLLWQSQKIAGGAQKRSGGVLLHHESITIPGGMDPAKLVFAIRQAFERSFWIIGKDTALDPELYFEAVKEASADKFDVCQASV